MMPGRIQPEELYVHHMGDPGEGVPVRGSGGGEGPGQPLWGNPGDDSGILEDIRMVVQGDEVVLQEELKSGRHQEQEDETDQNDSPARAPHFSLGGVRHLHIRVGLKIFQSCLWREPP